jgi:hypothetical protein
MGNLSERRGNAEAFAASTAKRIQEVKNWLMLEVATQSGAFWEQVRETRARWAVQAPTKLSPKDINLLYPERLRRSQAEDLEQYVYDSHNWDRDLGRLSSWLAVPGLERYREDVDWRPFMSALVLYQPPLDTLLEFAEYGGAVRRTPEYKREGQGSLDPKLVDPLIHELQHPYAVEGACRHYYETLLEEIGERYLKPRGLDIQAIRAEVLRDGPLEEDVQERVRQLPRDLYVEVPDESSVDELRTAVQNAASMRKEIEVADTPRASKSVLTRVELAYRHYCLGQRYLDVSDRYSPNFSSETFKRYAREGRPYLPEGAR